MTNVHFAGMQRLTCELSSKAATEIKFVLLKTEYCVCAMLLLPLAHPLANSHYILLQFLIN
jgi:hypothetical protein